eukprot:Gb_37264 [translate_table: standard]
MPLSHCGNTIPHSVVKHATTYSFSHPGATYAHFFILGFTCPSTLAFYFEATHIFLLPLQLHNPTMGNLHIWSAYTIHLEFFLYPSRVTSLFPSSSFNGRLNIILSSKELGFLLLHFATAILLYCGASCSLCFFLLGRQFSCSRQLHPLVVALGLHLYLQLACDLW